MQVVTAILAHFLRREEDIAILEQRLVLYEEAKKTAPRRWSGATRGWIPEKTVFQNPNKSSRKEV